MTKLYDEIALKFPEVRSRFNEGDEELPYVVMGHLADWLKDSPKEAITPEVVDRLVSFARWCEEQPSGKDASDDLFTILTVTFYEALFDSETTRALVPRFISHEQFLTGADYLRSWVGVENYEMTAKYYEPAA